MNHLLAKLDGMPLYLLWGEKVGGWVEAGGLGLKLGLRLGLRLAGDMPAAAAAMGAARKQRIHPMMTH
jgi:hypothetical protein